MCLTLGMFSETERKYNASSGPGETTHRDLTSSYLVTSCTCSIHKLLELLHRECLHCLGCRLGLEDARLFREWVHALPCWCRRLRLQLQIQHARDLERASLLHLRGRHSQHCLHHSPM